MTTKKLRAGVIGLGVGEQHAVGYDLHPDCHTVALCDINPDTLAAVGSRFPHCHLTTEPDELIEDPSLDLLSICSYDDAHYAQVMAALPAGKHLFVEKPLCTRRHELRDIEEMHAAHPECVLSSNLVLRRSPRFMDLKTRIGNFELGRIFLIEGDYNYGRLWKLTEGWRGQVPDYSVMLGGGVHLIDLMLWLTGDRVVEVTGFGSGIATAESTYPGDDTRVALLRFASGLLGKVSANFACVYPHHHRFSVYGTHATFENGIGSARLFNSRDPTATPSLIDTPYPGVAKHALLGSFIDTVVGRGTPDVTADEIFSCMRVCLCVDEAVRRGAVVAIE